MPSVREGSIVNTRRKYLLHYLGVMSASPPTKRRHPDEPGDEPVYTLDEEDDNYVPYVPVKQRKQQRLEQLASRGGAEGNRQEERPKKEEKEEKEDEELEEVKRREKVRKERTLLLEAQEVKAKKALEGQCCRPQHYPSNFL